MRGLRCGWLIRSLSFFGLSWENRTLGSTRWLMPPGTNGCSTFICCCCWWWQWCRWCWWWCLLRCSQPGNAAWTRTVPRGGNVSNLRVKFSKHSRQFCNFLLRVGKCPVGQRLFGWLTAWLLSGWTGPSNELRWRVAVYWFFNIPTA